jgi:enoyl-CoA hydratase/carnithine racemase
MSAASDEAPPLRTDRHGDVLLLTLDRPRKSNALNTALFDALRETLAGLPGSDVRAVVVTGAGERAFSAGADVGELAVMRDGSAEELVRRGQSVFALLEELPQPTVAAVNGVALGGGLELAMACDVRVAAEHATFGLPEITLANVPGWGATQRLPPLIGLGRATRMILSGERIEAERAEAWGLVTERVAGDALLGVAFELAGRLAAHSPLALDQAKRALRAGWRHGFAAGLDAERDAVVACSGSSDQRDATRAFLRRTPTSGSSSP